MHALASACRGFARNPAASALSVLTLATGIGLATAMLAVLNGTVWNPLPFPSADRLVALQGPVSAATIDDWSGAARSFDAVAGYRTKRYTLTGAGDAEALRATVGTRDLFKVLQARAAVGRTPGTGDTAAGAPVAVLSDECWRTLFHADPSVPGRTILLNGTPFAVVGVMPPGFRFPVNADRVDVYTTTAGDLQTDRRPAAGAHPRDLMVVARLRAGLDVGQARAEMEGLRAAGQPDADKRRTGGPPLVVPLAQDVAASVASPIMALAWAVAGVVVIACVTTTILSLIRVTSRRAEWATRLAIGAGPGDLARQVLAESVLIATAGGIAGSLLAVAGAKPLLLMAGAAVSAAARARFDATVWMAAAGATMAAAASVGLAPAIHAAATRGWSDSDRGASSGRPASVARNLLVTTEVALAIVLLAACVSLLRAYTVLARTDVGFQPTGVTTFRVDLADATYPARQQAELFERLREGAASIRGVSGAAFAAVPPFGDLRLTIRLAGPGDGATQARSGGAEVHLVSPGYFRTMGIPLVEGREFGAADTSESAPVIIVSRSAAARQFPGLDPLDRLLDVRVGPNARGPLPRVVGVVGDIRNGTLTAPGDPQVYLPFAQAPMLPSATFVVRVQDRPVAAVIADVRRQLRRLDAAIPLVSVRPLDELVGAATALPRFTTLVSGVFASAAVFLAMSGLYAVVAYAALCRRREFSIRRALGATEAGIARLVLLHCVKVLVPGVVVGVAGALAAGRLLESALFGVRPSPGPTLAVTVAAAAALALFAAWWPARSAGRDDLRTSLQSGT